MKIKDVMTRNPITLKPNDTLKKALRIMAKHKISGCPVVGARKNIVGVVSQADIIRLIDVYSKIHLSENVFEFIFSMLKSKDEGLKRELKKIENIKVKEFMKKKVISIDINEDFYTAARLINKHDIDRLPVVKGEKLVGIVTRADIIKALEKLEEGG
jgi:CBS domain-containing protein